MRTVWLVLVAVLLTAAAVFVLRTSWAGGTLQEVPWVSHDLDPPPEFVRSLEETVLGKSRQSLDLLGRSTPEKIDSDIRYTWRNGTLKSEAGGTLDLPLRFALHHLGHILRLGHLIPGGQDVVAEARNIYLNITGSLGYIPGFDTGCAGPFNLLGAMEVVPRDHSSVVNTLKRLLDIRMPDGGWMVVLDYSRSKGPDGRPYNVSGAYVTAAAIVALRKAGYPLEDPVVQRATYALDRAVLDDNYRGQFQFGDYLVGNGDALMAYKKNGITSIDAYRKARSVLLQDLQANPAKPDHMVNVAYDLLGLQGVVPEGAEPYRLGLQSILRTYDSVNHTWRTDTSTMGPGFFNSTTYNMVPLMVLYRNGYKGGWLDTRLEPPPPVCGNPEVRVESASGSTRLHVRATGARSASVDFTTDGYRTIQNASLAKDGDAFSGAIPGGDFQVALQCGPGYELTSWYRP